MMERHKCQSHCSTCPAFMLFINMGLVDYELYSTNIENSYVIIMITG